jgi:hypothetical protein
MKWEAWIILSSDQNFMIWKENRHRGFGRCHSAYPGQKLKELMVYYAKISLYEKEKLGERSRIFLFKERLCEDVLAP